MAKVEDTQENAATCLTFCGSCPTYPGVEGEALFCSRGKSSAAVTKNGCNCGYCDVKRKYSCSGPTEVLTCPASISIMLSIRRACLFIASMERSKGTFISRASPVYEINAVGMHSVIPPELSSFRKAGDVVSQAV